MLFSEDCSNSCSEKTLEDKRNDDVADDNSERHKWFLNKVVQKTIVLNERLKFRHFR